MVSPTASASINGKRRFLNDRRRPAGRRARRWRRRRLNENMTLALRVTIESEGKIVIYGDSFQVTASGAKSLVGS